jgi:hypothetical protein
MFLLYCDETNLDPKENTFFIYGGVVIPCESAKTLHDSIESIRNDADIPSDFKLKFNPRPTNVTHQEFLGVKQSIMETSIGHKCTLLVSMILHDVATSPNDARRNEINRVIFHFNSFLNRNKSHGLVLIDRFSDSQIDSHLREKFAIGLRGMPYAGTMRLENILGYHYSAIGQSHFGSIVDIILGSLRYAVNAHITNDSSKLQTAKQLLRIIAPLFWRNPNYGKVSEISLFFSPKIIKADIYRVRYQALKDLLAASGIDTEQEITDVRTY